MNDPQPIVFLSYAKEDRRRVLNVYRALREAGLRPWMDAPPKPWHREGIHEREDVVMRAERGEERSDVAIGDDPGYIYVMHNPAHDKNMFKVGLTRRTSELRSEELSGTGAPDKFLVAHEWRVRDCAAAEKAAHEALDAYRMNPKREFFRLPYETLLKMMSSVVGAFV